MNCIVCENEICQERIDLLPHIKTCVKCSDTKRKIGISVWDKTTSTFLCLSSEDAEEYWRLERMDGRLGRL